MTSLVTVSWILLLCRNRFREVLSLPALVRKVLPEIRLASLSKVTFQKTSVC